MTEAHRFACNGLNVDDALQGARHERLRLITSHTEFY